MKTKLLLFAILLSSMLLQAQHPGYDKLERNLDGVGGMRAGWFTVFCGLDVNFADGRFSRFLQNSKLAMAMEESSVKVSPGSFSMKYTPRVSSKTAYIAVGYTLDRNSVIKSVEIAGTPEVILNLFLYYWQYKINVEDGKSGELANYSVMGDRVSLISLDKNSSKITITPKVFDYFESFGIK